MRSFAHAIRASWLLLGVLAPAAGCTRARPAEHWPAPDWEPVRPASVGLDSVMLSELDRDFADGKYHFVDAMLVTRHGLLAYEASYRHDYAAAYAGRDTVSRMYNYYDPAWHPFHAGSDRHTMQSVTKSVLSAVFGVALGRGDLAGIDTAVVGFFDPGSVAALDGRKRRLTVRHLLGMRAGLAWDESSVPYTDPRNNCAVMEASDDWVSYAIGRPMAAEPGDTFVYNSGASQILAHVFRRATGQDPAEYAARHLFEPLGITDVYWKRTPAGLPDTEGGLYLLPRDLARIGLLYLRRGRWRDTRLVPEEWIAASTTPAPTGGGFGYGLHWWLVPYPDGSGRVAWAALGYGGQRLLILPDEDIVAVFTGWNIDEHPALPAAEMVERLLGTITP